MNEWRGIEERDIGRRRRFTGQSKRGFKYVRTSGTVEISESTPHLSLDRYKVFSFVKGQGHVRLSVGAFAYIYAKCADPKVSNVMLLTARQIKSYQRQMGTIVQHPVVGVCVSHPL